ncbi:transmembrane protein 144b [Denticeps clupeoides]|uniref:transmembrane protein 144b n=1 Tax=Denticeps clupeoides TaxID=299321 RepID=UPI0010A2F4E0|nr:transmembrane protein 144 [Denticeps clupeoides]
MSSAAFCVLLVSFLFHLKSALSVKEETAGLELDTDNSSEHGVQASAYLSDHTYGFVACLLSIVLYGSYLLPVKKLENGDGMFFQWTSCVAIWIVGTVGDMALGSPKIHPLAMLGGALWATGNVAAIHVVKLIGLALGVLLWGSSGLLMGWASSRFGWFGTKPEEVPYPMLNYCGAALCALSSVIFFFVKSDVRSHLSSETTPLLFDRSTGPANSWMDSIAPKTKRIIGCCLAILCGLFYGSSFVPVLYIKHHSSSNVSRFTGSSQYNLDYCFAQCNGVFLASSVYFLIYCIGMKNRPRVYPRAILPGFLTGTMWAVATYSWFMASNYLSAVVTFPIVSAALFGSLPGDEVISKRSN